MQNRTTNDAALRTCEACVALATSAALALLLYQMFHAAVQLAEAFLSQRLPMTIGY